MIDRRWFVNNDLDNVKIFVNRALGVEDDYIRIASGEIQVELQVDPSEVHLDEDELDDDEDYGFEEYERAVDIVFAYHGIVARAALNEINSIIEYELKVISAFISHLQGKTWDKCWVKSREKACKIIESTYDISLKDLPGYLEIEKVRKVINAYKHDAGYSGEYEPFAGRYVEMEKQYKLDIDEILKCVDAAKSFLASIPGERPNLGEEIPRRLKFNINHGSTNELE